MSEVEKVKLKFTGTVVKNYLDQTDGKRSIFLEPKNPATIEKIEEIITKSGWEFSGDNYPVKETDDGKYVVKTSSKYDVKVENEDCSIEELGAGSEIVAYVILKEGVYKRRTKYVSAYLVAIKLLKFVELDEFNPFTDEEFADLT